MIHNMNLLINKTIREFTDNILKLKTLKILYWQKIKGKLILYNLTINVADVFSSQKKIYIYIENQ